MLKIIKRIGLILLALIAIFVIATLIWLSSINPNAYKSEIETSISEIIKYPVQIHGNIDFHVSPTIRFAINNLVINQSYQLNTPLLASGYISGKINLLPLLVGKFAVGEITFKQPVLNLLSNQQGKKNFEGLPPKLAYLKTISSKAKTVASILAASKIILEDASIVWNDMQNKKQWHMQNINLQMDSLLADEPAQIELKTSIKNVNSQSSARLTIQALMNLNLEKRTIAIDNIDAQIELWGKGAMHPVPVSIQGNGLYDNNDNSIFFDTTFLSVDKIHGQATISINNASNTPLVNFNIIQSTLNKNILTPFLGLNSHHFAQEIMLSASGVWHVKRQLIQCDTFKLTDNNISLHGSGEISPFDKKPKIRTTMAVNINTMDITRSSKTAAVSTKTAYVTPSTVTSLAALSRTQDITQLLLLPFSDKFKIDANIQLSIKQLKYKSLNIEDIQVDIKTKAKKIIIDVAPLTLFDGQIKTQLAVEMKDGTFNWDISGNANNVMLEKLLAITHETKNTILQGNTNLNYNLSASGKNKTSIGETLNGKIHFSIQDIILLDTNLAQSFERILVLIHDKPIMPSLQKLMIHSIDSKINLENGNANNHKLSITMPFLNINGAGTANVISEVVDYRLMLQFTDDNSNTLTMVPLQLSNTLSNLQSRFDLQHLMEGQQATEMSNTERIKLLKQEFHKGLAAFLIK